MSPAAAPADTPRPAGGLLVATDLSAPARHALQRGVRLAALGGTGLGVVHAIELDALDALHELLGGRLGPAKAALQADAQSRLQALCEAEAGARGVPVQAHVRVGAPLRVILGEAEAQDARLLVLAARGEAFLRHALVGSTAMRLLRKSARWPVLVVKQPARSDYRSVLVAIDFSPASLVAVRHALRWAPRAEIVLLHAFDLPYEGKLHIAGVEEAVIRQYRQAGIGPRRARLHALAAEAGLPADGYRALVCVGEPSEQILAQEQVLDPDLVVVGKHGTHLAEELLLGSVTKRLLADTQADVLVVADGRGPPGELP